VRSEVSRFALTELVSFRLARVLLEPPRRPDDGDGIAERDPQPRLGVDRIACADQGHRAQVRSSPPDLPVGYGDERRLAQVLLHQRDQVHGYRLRGGERRRTTYQRWSAAAPDGFAFAVKAPKEITHALRLAGADAALVLEQVTGLAAMLFQLPPSLAFDRNRSARSVAALRARSTRNRPLLSRPINDAR
jgi:Protein of unknown function DUF72